MSMDGKGAWRDNVFVERLWRFVKYEEVYLHAYDSVSAARAGIGRYLDLYNRRRPHSSLDDRTPDQAYFGQPSLLPVRLAAKHRQTIHLSKRKTCPKNWDHLSFQHQRPATWINPTDEPKASLRKAPGFLRDREDVQLNVPKILLEAFSTEHHDDDRF